MDVVELLEDDDELVRRVALRAVESMSGIRIGAAAPRWRLWYAQECDWRDDRLEQEMRLLESEDYKIVAGTLLTLSRHRLFRDALIVDVAQALDHDDPVVRAAACAAQAGLKAPYAAHELVDLLEDPEPGVRKQALNALRAVTGMTHGADREAWKAALRRS
jgi:HEAT repeat protein